ncbi:beta-ketoacyl synthase N-terminal-like domain-containing protein [Spongisporangium articulatum]|uniref:Beta-ketoacyl synthase N-terminal-like domain-containing protein n=1 Tax=Spongisporangium articulatum TaxID=3362603 RepID=A0ABW8AHL2_9ACTN
MKKVPVVITGIGVINALGRNKDEYWQNLVDGKSGVRLATDHEFVGMEGVYLGEVEDEWVAEGLPEGADTGGVRMNALALVAAKQALEDSGLDLSTIADKEFGMVVGQCQATAGPTVGTYLPFHEATDKVANHFGLTGPRVLISTACAAGGNAVGTGRDMLWDGTADIVLAGGVDDLQKGSHLGFELLGAISDEPTAPYSRSDGLSLGEGAAFLVLETKASAEARGAKILAEVAGYGLSADAYHATAPDPTGKGPLRAVRRALVEADLTPEDVSYVNGHGTGTPTNDRMERKAMRSFFGERVREVPMSATKAALGHSLGASGAIEAVTCVMAIQNGVVPPTVNFHGEAPEDYDFIPHKGRAADVQITLSNNYAFGGNNCSLVLAKPGRLNRAEETTTDRKILVTGLGVVSGFGLGVDAWREGVAKGESAIGKITSFDAAKYGTEFGVEPFPLGAKPLAAASLWRHLAGYGRQALAATTFAFQDAGLKTNGPGRENVGLIFATGYGPIETAVELMIGMQSPEGASALSFANATVNAAAGAVCQALTLRGPTTTIASGGASALIALDSALQLLKTGHADRLVLLAIDDFCEAVMMERSKHDQLSAEGVVRPYDQDRSGTVLGSAAVAILLEAEEIVEARGGKAYAQVGGVAHGGVSHQQDAATAERVLKNLLSRSGTDAAEIGLVAGSGTGADRDDAELAGLSSVFGPELNLTAPKSLTGECEAASGGINMLTAILAVAEGVVPATANLTNPSSQYPFAHVTEPKTGADVNKAIATATTPSAAFGAALFTSV